MNDSPSPDSVRSSASEPALDEAIEYCLKALESTGDVDVEQLIAQFPQWSEELAEFLENWGGMEQMATALSDPMAPVLLPQVTERSRFGDFELLDKIGFGGMGVIFRARQISLDREVAVKMILGEHRDHERFQMEAEAAAALSHPNIVPIYEIGEHEGRLFFSMRLIEGGNLREYIDRGPIPPHDAARIVSTIAHAVSYAHQHGILHRDLKPANVLMDDDGEPHITDFGLAKQISRDTEITRSGTIMGTPGYMAPEQATGNTKSLTTSTDVYGLGAILYALLIGMPPFSGDSSLEVLRRVVDEPPVAPRVHRPAIDRDLETICLKCLEKDPDARYGSADLLAEDLARFLKNQPVKARPISSIERFQRWCRRNPAIALLSLAVAALLLSTTTSSLFLAFSERNARLQSEENSRTERTLRQRADQAKQKHEEAAEAAVQSQAELCLTNGFWQSRQSQLGDALLWFAESVKLTKYDLEKQVDNQRRYLNWLDHQPIPIAAMSMEEGYRELEEFSARDDIQFRPNSTQLLCEASKQVVVWDYESDRKWNLHDDYSNLSAVAWSGSGEQIAVGCTDGKLQILDSESHQLVYEFQLDQPVRQIAFSKDDQLLTASDGKQVRVWDVWANETIPCEYDLTGSVVHLSFDQVGENLLVVTQLEEHSGMAQIYGIREPSMEPRLSVPCRVDESNESRRAFWPNFVSDDQFLVVRQRESTTEEAVWFRIDTGQAERRIPFDTHKYSISVSADGNQFVAGDVRSVDIKYFNDRSVVDAEKASDVTESGIQGQLEKDAELEFHFPHDDRVTTVSYSSTGLIASGGWDSAVKLWELKDADSVELPVERLVKRAVLTHQSRVRQVVFSPDSTLLATSQRDGLIRVWRVPSSDVSNYRVAVPQSGSMVRIVDSKHWILSGMSRWSGRVQNVKMLDTESGRVVGGTRELKAKVDGTIMDSICLPDENLMITIHSIPLRNRRTVRVTKGTAGSIRFWNMSTGESVREPITLKCEPRWIEQNPTSSQVAICLADLSVIMIDTGSLEQEAVLIPNFDIPNSPANKTAQVDSDKAFKHVGSLYPTHRCNQQLAYSPDGKSLVAWSSKQRGLWCWDTETFQLRFRRLRDAGWSLSRVNFSPDGTKIAIAGGRNKTVYIIDSNTGEFIFPEPDRSSVAYQARFSPDGQRLVVASRDRKARVFDVNTGELLLSNMSHVSDVVDSVYTPDSRFILTLGFKELRVWNAKDGSLALKPIPVPARSRQISVTSDSRFAIIAGGQWEVAVFDLQQLSDTSRFDMQQMILLSELVSNKTIVNGIPVTLSTKMWISRWNEYQGTLNNAKAALPE